LALIIIPNRIGFPSSTQDRLPQPESASRRRRNANSGEKEEEEPNAEAILLSAEHRGIGWMCGEPMADYAHVVFQAKG